MAAKMLATALMLVASAPAIIRAQGLPGALQGPADPAAQGNAMDGTMADPDAPMPIEEMIPDAAELGLLPSPFFVIPDAEYAGNPDVKDLTRFQLDSATACAAECAKNPECHMATWMGANPAWKAGKNCFLKSTPRLCEMPSDITDEPTAYLLVHKAWECSEGVLESIAGSVEAPAMAPVAMEDEMANDFAFAPEPAAAGPAVTRTPIPPLAPRSGNTNSASLPGQQADKDAARSCVLSAAAVVVVAVLSVAALG